MRFGSAGGKMLWFELMAAEPGGGEFISPVGCTECAGLKAARQEAVDRRDEEKVVLDATIALRATSGTTCCPCSRRARPGDHRALSAFVRLDARRRRVAL
jgi:hypothetical protein